MKKSMLALGSALMFFAATAKADNIEFGAKVGGSKYLPLGLEMSIAANTLGFEHAEIAKGYVVGNLSGVFGFFANYMVIEDALLVGAELGYANRGLSKDGKLMVKDKEVSLSNTLNVHTVEGALVGSYLAPVGRQYGQPAVEFGVKGYWVPTAVYGKSVNMSMVAAKDAASPATADKVEKGAAGEKGLNTWNVGGTVGVSMKDIMETGVSVSVRGDIFAFDMFSADQDGEAKKKAFGLTKENAPLLGGVHATVGMDLAKWVL